MSSGHGHAAPSNRKDRSLPDEANIVDLSGNLAPAEMGLVSDAACPLRASHTSESAEGSEVRHDTRSDIAHLHTHAAGEHPVIDDVVRSACQESMQAAVGTATLLEPVLFEDTHAIAEAEGTKPFFPPMPFLPPSRRPEATQAAALDVARGRAHSEDETISQSARDNAASTLPRDANACHAVNADVSDTEFEKMRARREDDTNKTTYYAPLSTALGGAHVDAYSSERAKVNCKVDVACTAASGLEISPKADSDDAILDLSQSPKTVCAEMANPVSRLDCGRSDDIDSEGMQLVNDISSSASPQAPLMSKPRPTLAEASQEADSDSVKLVSLRAAQERQSHVISDVTDVDGHEIVIDVASSACCESLETVDPDADAPREVSSLDAKQAPDDMGLRFTADCGYEASTSSNFDRVDFENLDAPQNVASPMKQSTSGDANLDGQQSISSDVARATSQSCSFEGKQALAEADVASIVDHSLEGLSTPDSGGLQASKQSDVDGVRLASLKAPQLAHSDTSNPMSNHEIPDGVKVGTIQRRLTWPLHKDDTHKSRCITNETPDGVDLNGQWSGDERASSVVLESRQSAGQTATQEGNQAAANVGLVCLAESGLGAFQDLSTSGDVDLDRQRIVPDVVPAEFTKRRCTFSFADVDAAHGPFAHDGKYPPDGQQTAADVATSAGAGSRRHYTFSFGSPPSDVVEASDACSRDGSLPNAQQTVNDVARSACPGKPSAADYPLSKEQAPAEDITDCFLNSSKAADVDRLDSTCLKPHHAAPSDVISPLKPCARTMCDDVDAETRTTDLDAAQETCSVEEKESSDEAGPLSIGKYRTQVPQTADAEVDNFACLENSQLAQSNVTTWMERGQSATSDDVDYQARSPYLAHPDAARMEARPCATGHGPTNEDIGTIVDLCPDASQMADSDDVTVPSSLDVALRDVSKPMSPCARSISDDSGCETPLNISEVARLACLEGRGTADPRMSLLDNSFQDSVDCHVTASKASQEQHFDVASQPADPDVADMKAFFRETEQVPADLGLRSIVDPCLDTSLTADSDGVTLTSMDVAHSDVSIPVSRCACSTSDDSSPDRKLIISENTHSGFLEAHGTARSHVSRMEACSPERKQAAAQVCPATTPNVCSEAPEAADSVVSVDAAPESFNVAQHILSSHRTTSKDAGFDDRQAVTKAALSTNYQCDPAIINVFETHESRTAVAATSDSEVSPRREASPATETDLDHKGGETPSEVEMVVRDRSLGRSIQACPEPVKIGAGHLEDADLENPMEYPPRATDIQRKQSEALAQRAIESKRLQSSLETEEKAADLGLLGVAAEGVMEAQGRTDEAWAKLQQAMGIDAKASQRDAFDAWLSGIVNLCYLTVIFGCEIDLYGFMMAYRTYWQMGNLELQILLVVCPVGYLLAAIMYMCYGNRTATQQEQQQATGKPPDAESPREFVAAARLTAREPINLRFFHFLPVCRYYLVTKEKEPSDVEGLFRVNSLSSFSLGFAQLSGILLQLFILDQEADVFVKINVASQIMNWSITLMYFTTPVSARMKAAIKVSALIYNCEKELQRTYERHLELSAEYATNPSDENLAAMQHIDACVNREICRYLRVDLDLTKFDIKCKMDALGLIRRKQFNFYARI